MELKNYCPYCEEFVNLAVTRDLCGTCGNRDLVSPPTDVLLSIRKMEAPKVVPWVEEELQRRELGG